MTLLTLDRFAEVSLNIKYDQHISTHRTHIAIYVVWLIGATLFAVMSCLEGFFAVNSIGVMHLYVLQTLFLALIIVSVTTYGYIFLAIRRTKRQSTCSNGEASLKHIFVPLWIVLTFLLFFELPNIILLLYIHIKHEMSDVMYFGAMVLIDCGCSVDVLIYVLMSQPLRKRFLDLIGYKT